MSAPMYAVVVRACPIQHLFMLSLFEPNGVEASEWTRPVALGLPQNSTLAFKDALILSDDEMSLLLGIGTRRLSDWPQDAAQVDAASGERLMRCARLFAIALHVLDDRAAAVRWLKSPQRELGDFIPLLLAQTGPGARAAEAMLGRMEHGVYS